MSDVLLELSELRVRFGTPDGPVTAIDGLDVSIARGERVALVGESGSGKSVTAQAVLGILRGASVDGSVRFANRELLGLPDREVARLRGDRMGLVFQDPLSSLNPVMRVGKQIMEPLLIRGVAKHRARARAVDLLDRLGVPEPQRRIDDYPHQFSGGLRQRVMIAIAAIAEPDLLIADEPTTALDVQVQEQVLELLYDLAAERDMAVLLITHDLGIVAGYTDRVVVMNRGRKIEEGPVREVFHRPVHDYTKALLAAVPRVDRDLTDRLAVVGDVPPGGSGDPRSLADTEVTEP